LEPADDEEDDDEERLQGQEDRPSTEFVRGAGPEQDGEQVDATGMVSCRLRGWLGWVATLTKESNCQGRGPRDRQDRRSLKGVS
jgi:hypothetical protein